MPGTAMRADSGTKTQLVHNKKMPSLKQAKAANGSASGDRSWSVAAQGHCSSPPGVPHLGKVQTGAASLAESISELQAP